MSIGLMYALGAAITWGLVYTIDQKILLSTSPMTLLFINSLVTAIIMLPFIFSEHASIRLLLSSGKANLLLILLSIILATCASFFIFSGIKLIGAPSASIVEIAYPFFVILFTFLFFRIVPNIYFLIGAVFIFIGSAIIIYFN